MRKMDKGNRQVASKRGLARRSLKPDLSPLEVPLLTGRWLVGCGLWCMGLALTWLGC